MMKLGFGKTERDSDTENGQKEGEREGVMKDKAESEWREAGMKRWR